MSRYSDIATTPHREPHPPLPAVDWQAVGRGAPRQVGFDYGGSKAPLPKADVVVITWTTAEWSALDHVFVNSSTTRSASSSTFQDGWYAYTRGAPKIPATGKYKPAPLWGFFQLVSIDDRDGKAQKVLVFKSSAHLAHPLWIEALEEMVHRIIEDTEPDRIYSIGTAGGATVKELLGDTAITNSAKIELQQAENRGTSYNGKTFSSPWYPSLDLVSDVEKKLLFRLNTVLTDGELDYLLSALHATNPASKHYGLADLVNAAVKPSNLGNPRAIPAKDLPLLTTDFYFIANGDNAKNYCVLEMDDAVIAKIAGDMGVKYCFVRNVSDPIVPNVTRRKEPIPDNVREDWSHLIYKEFGFYSSFNGALLTWATIADHSTGGK